MPIINYHASAATRDYFFPEDLRAIINDVSNLHKNRQSTIDIFPDAMFKSNGIPNGISITTLYKDTLLLPLVLRDPGCGFLSFKVSFHENPPTNWQQTIGPKLDQLLNRKRSTPSYPANAIKPKNIEQVLLHGLHSLDLSNEELALFANTKFDADENIVNPSTQEQKNLYDDLFTLTNNVELRSIDQTSANSQLSDYQLDKTDYIGFVHSGCYLFPEILAERFVQRICEYADINKLATVDEIRTGLFGVPMNTELGKEYYEWLKAAMNFSLVSRYGIFYAIKSFIEAELSCTVTMINDRIHAGIIKKQCEGKTFYQSVRGVQMIDAANDHSIHSLGILAGNRETSAALVCGNNKANNYFSHGTNCNIYEDHDYETYFSQHEKQNLMARAKNFYANTPIELSECIPLSYNFDIAKRYFVQEDVVHEIAELHPELNIFGDVMKRNYGYINE